MLLLAILLPGVSLILNGRIIGGLLAIILQIIACLTFVVFGFGFLLWLLLVIWAINARSNVKTERKLKTMERRILVNQLIINEQEQTFSAPQQVKEERIVEEQTPKIESPKKETKSAFVLFMGFIGQHKKPILKYGIPLVLLIILIKIVYVFIEPDFSNPLKVLQETEKQWKKNDLKNYYSYLSKKSQMTYKSYEEFIRKKTIPDSVLASFKTISISFDEMPVSDAEKFRRFKITENYIEGKDTVNNNIKYRTLFNENGKWKLVWNKEAFSDAQNHSQQGDFTKAKELCYSAIEIDPYTSIMARNLLVNCYIRDTARPQHWQDTVAYHLNLLLKLDSTYAETYNTIGCFYSNINKNEKAVKNFLTAVKYSKDSSEIANYYSNAAQNAKIYSVPNAEKYLKKSLEYNSKSRFTWQTYGDLFYSKNNYSEAKVKYEKAIELVTKDNNVDNYTLISLYGYYAVVCKKLGYKEKAEEYTLKCVRVYPDKSHPVFKLLNL